MIQTTLKTHKTLMRNRGTRRTSRFDRRVSHVLHLLSEMAVMVFDHPQPTMPDEVSDLKWRHSVYQRLGDVGVPEVYATTPGASPSFCRILRKRQRMACRVNCSP